MAGTTAYPAAFDTDAVILQPNNWFDDTDSGDDTLTVAGVTHQVGDLVQWLQNAGAIMKAIQQEAGVNPSGTFADIASRINARQTVRKTADQAFASTTLASVTDLSFAVAASLDYTFSFDIPFTASTTTSGLALAVSCPASPSYIVYTAEFFVVTSAANIQGVATASASKIQGPTAVAAAGTVYMARIKGVLSNGANAGTLQLQASEGGGTTASQTIKKGAYGEMYVN